ncbi:MAG: alpha-amylase [Acidobacteria bacterium]|nr:alpha-amylase [Acidobacteriota bacterium]
MPGGRLLFEFHVSRECRERYRFDAAIYGLTGNVLLADMAAARDMAARMNAVRDARSNPALAVNAADLNAMALIDELMHLMAAAYRRQVGDGLFGEALAFLRGRVGEPEVDGGLEAFTGRFPPQAVHRGESTPAAYLAGATAGYAHAAAATEELLLLSLANANPAFAPYVELFDDAPLRKDTAYPGMVEGLDAFFRSLPGFGETGLSFLDFLTAPLRAFPNSLSDQLRYIREHWRAWIPGDVLDRLILRLLRALDILEEEHKHRAFWKGGEPEPGTQFGLDGLRGLGADAEPEQYSPDLDWMPNVVMMAKNTHVWLWQLSRKYGREIARLDQVPDEELDALARRGFTALWLIGVWERSVASGDIKRRMGNPEALCSAYSLFEYRIAGDLGGDDAYWALKDRAWQRGVRVAVDMVPNHTGLFSRWVLEHPEWFIQVDHPPYPCYTFNGPDLSRDPNVGLYIEDGYWNRSDAAVVFKRVDHRTGDTRYIYHGNDGTHMPWNDTAQLNYLRADVREAVIGEVLRVARYSSIIRFDAAMTLAKRHYQRLWFPEPGAGGDIPSRAERGLTKEAFNEAIPQEFWREVVDRCAAEAPDTLLLAEAFWLMEGYFVRTLGMHRVYNSAFMNMLKREDNANYRTVLRNILEFDPEILKRFVNFMNNPDEEPAVAQFGKDDKYFGVCVMLATLPGLPMYGHGQVEGFGEKYGMEYARPYWDETPDHWLEERHAREVFPLLRRRWLFSGVENFRLYDVVDDQGNVREDVFAYSNGRGSARALVVYNNRFAHNAGWVRLSVSFRDRGAEDLVRRTLGEGLALSGDPWTVYRDAVTGLEYLRPTGEIRRDGLHVSLDAFKYQVFLDFRAAEGASEAEWANLHRVLGGRGVPSLREALVEERVRPVLRRFSDLVASDLPERFRAAAASRAARDETALSDRFTAVFGRLLEAARASIPGDRDWDALQTGITARVLGAARLDAGQARMGSRRAPGWRRLAAAFRQTAAGDALDGDLQRKLFYAFLVTEPLLGLASDETMRGLFRRHAREVLPRCGLDPHFADEHVTLWSVLTSSHRPGDLDGLDDATLGAILNRADVQACLGCNWYNGIYWFSREKFLLFLSWVFVVAALEILQTPAAAGTGTARALIRLRDRVLRAVENAEKAQYNYHRFTALCARAR